MASKIRTITIDCANPARLAEFWTAALGYTLKDIDEEGALLVGPDGQNSRILFLVVPEGKTVKNRLHFDLTPEDTRAAEVERLKGLGATVYQEFDWTVMRDPEGNEFCVEAGPGDKKVPASEPAQA
jgi:catechol 2,3-dioxygenase-like lactoylglutathione lyase family enzyme